jgi:hypothetical protein
MDFSAAVAAADPEWEIGSTAVEAVTRGASTLEKDHTPKREGDGLTSSWNADIPLQAGRN